MADRLLVMRGGALGDFVLGLPALRALREAFPAASLELIAPGAVLPLAAPLVDAATPLERGEMASLFGEEESLPPELAARYRHLDLGVLWLADVEGLVRRNFRRLGTRRLLHAPALPSTPGLHAADHLLQTLRPLGIAAASAVPALSPGAAALERASALLAGEPGPSPRPRVSASPRPLSPSPSLVAIHPGSGGEWKRWPAERFAAVIDGLAGAGHRTLLIQGPADGPAVRQVLAGVRGVLPPVISDLDVETLAALLSLCACYLGNDSGVTHLAAATGVPTVAIFGPTDPAVWGPRGPRVTLLRADQECAPCSREAATRCPSRDCLAAVAVEQVLEVVAASI